MLRVSNINTKISFKENPVQSGKTRPVAIPSQTIDKKDILIGSVATAAVAMGVIFLTRGRAIKSKDGSVLLTSKQVKIFENQMKQFASDIDFRKDLLSAIGLNTKDYAILRPIVGPEEYRNILTEFSDSSVHYSPGKSLITHTKDGFDYSGKENGTFRANMHMHTTNSDGKMSVLELLDQAAEYADFVAEKIKGGNAKASHAPFTVAITDHDTIEGCKEAVKIIAGNPSKYQNLRVILGCEMSIDNKGLEGLRSPVDTHMLLHSINPFDEKLNAFLDGKKTERIKLVNQIIANSVQNTPPEYKDTVSKLSYQEARAIHPVLKYGLTHIYNPTKDYLQFRTIFAECFEKNQELQTELAQKGVNLNKTGYLTPIRKYFSEINQNFGNDYWRKYQKALTMHVADLLEVSEEEAAKKIIVPDKLQNLLRDFHKIATAETPKLNLQPAYVDMDEIIGVIKAQKYGYMGIAHPCMISMGNYVNDASTVHSAMKNMFRKFKEKGGDRALFAEGHYHYFGELGNDKLWINSVNGYAKDAQLYSSGGLDCHGESIFNNER